MHMHMCMHMCMCMCMCIHMHMCMHMCMFMYVRAGLVRDRVCVMCQGIPAHKVVGGRKRAIGAA